MTDNPSIQVRFTDDFKKQTRKLSKRYRNLRKDLQPLLNELASGNCPGDQISGTTYTVFKVRVKNSDIKKGKSGGYRVIYYLQTQDSIILTNIYSKSDRADIDAKTIKDAIARYESQDPSRIAEDE